jgi:hypothetical protein
MATVTESAGTVQMPHTLFADAVTQVSAIAHAKLGLRKDSCNNGHSFSKRCDSVMRRLRQP